MMDITRNMHRVSRSISAENKTGEKNGGARAVVGCGAQSARNLGVGWKVSPCVELAPKEVYEFANIDGPGMIKSMWMTHTQMARFLILRIYWDGQEAPAIEVPLGDFFANAWGKYYQNSSLMVQVNPGYGLNCCWEMPFQKHCKMTLENLHEESITFFYQIHYELGEIASDSLYFHAYYHRSNPLAYKTPHILLPKIKGNGHYVGTSMFWQMNSNLWWGEGEIKFYIDDDEYPTICGTGTEDYFGGAWNFENPTTKRYQDYTTPYAGIHVFVPDGVYQANVRFQMYRWHICDPIHFEKNLYVDIQALGWKNGYKEYHPLQDDIASISYWYQSLEHEKLRLEDTKERLEII